jgi:solute carrier family 44 protein 1 (choline transporter-like protein)
MRKRINLVIKLFSEAQKILIDIPYLFIMPFITIALLAIFILYWILTAFMIYSFGEYNSEDIYFLRLNIKKINFAKFMWFYHIIGLIWISEFIIACQELVVSGSVVKWYFKRYIIL